jgi:alginate O-acetyltransferase complex protein AlgI
MLFNSVHFLIFYPVVVCAFFALNKRYRWLLLLIASYYFYMVWEPIYILLIIASTSIDFIAARRIAGAKSLWRKRSWLIASIAVNLGLLLSFKYFNFFAGIMQDIFDTLSISVRLPESDLLLPVGISFYTFQTLSYTIECYKGKFTPEKHLGIFALYVAFFPQLVAGPIERPGNLLKQLRKQVVFDYQRVTLGIKRIGWGLFKKVVVADRLAAMVDSVYGNPQHHEGPVFVLATVLFAFQIYCDFSGYSDIAIGAAKILGIDLMENFRSPYFSRSIAEFWRRWHISLSTWFRDYVYIPLGGYKVSLSRRCLALIAVFLISGLWHGANWTFVIWGALHGVYLLCAVLMAGPLKRVRVVMNRWPIVFHVIQVALTLVLVNFAWIFFRASSLPDALYIISHIGAGWDLAAMRSIISGLELGSGYMAIAAGAIIAVIVFDIIDSRKSVWTVLSQKPWWVRWAVYYAIVSAILTFGVFNQSAFLYFQF